MPDSDRRSAAEFVKKVGVNYPIAIASEEFVQAFGGIIALPITFYIRPDGLISERVLGVSDWQAVENKIQAAAAHRTR